MYGPGEGMATAACILPSVGIADHRGRCISLLSEARVGK